MIRSELVVTKRTPLAPRGMVVAEHPLGADVGAAILARGGNAVDAAVAAAFTMTVAEPFMSTIGGSGTMLIHLEREGSTVALDFNVRAPLAASETMFRVVGGPAGTLFSWPRVEGDVNIFGYRSVAVPGSVAGLTLALQRWGTMELADVLAPAIALARGGFVPDWYQALTTARVLEELRAFPETARTYLRNGGIYRPASSTEPGERMTFPDLAASLALIARDGADAFYRGAIAQAIADDMKAHGGLITREDLAAYQVRTTDPLRGRYRDLDLALSPGSTGGPTALQILNVLGEFPADRVGYAAARGLHHRALAIRHAMQDRLALMADPEQVKVPWDRLLSRDYAREVAAVVRKARGDGAPSQPAAPAPRNPRGRRARDAGECTTHISVIDKQRNMVALTHTALSIYGSRVVARGTGILLNNGMMWFDPQPGHPNSLGPGKRALVNMVPALAFRKGEPYLTVGAPGGRRILGAVPQVLANVADGKTALQVAVEAPRVYADGGPLIVDETVGAKILGELGRLGWALSPRKESYATANFAKPVAIRVTSKGLEAGLDALRPAAAAGH
jgi:gamma-glutamyltranspeptidase / glutathione hydrolase